MRYKYYTVARPSAPGAVPTDGLLHSRILDERVLMPDINRRCWGWVYYNRPLTATELVEYELVPSPETGAMYE